MTRATPNAAAGGDDVHDASARAAPLSDGRRLEALARYGVLDTGPEPGFDALARLAAEICGTPVGLITFVDDRRQFFKAATGFAGDRVSPLAVGFCPQVVEDGAAVTIADTLADPRHAENPAARNGVRFYAGVPLVTSDEHVLGTLCVLDTEPRPQALTARERQSLEALAGQVVSQLELRRSETMARAERARAEKHARRLSLVARAASLLLAGRDPATTVRALFALVGEGFGVDVGFHYRCGVGDLGLVAAAGMTAEQERSAVRLEFGQTVCGIVAERREPMHVSGIQGSDEELFRPLKGLGLESYYSTPLLTGDALLGTISFGRRGTAFSPGEIEALQTIASQLATSLERQHADAALRALNETLEERIEEHSASLRLYGNIVQSDGSPVVAFDTDRRITAFNAAHRDAYLRVYGIQQQVGDSLLEQMLPDQAAVVDGFMRRALAGESFVVREPFGDPARERPYWQMSYNPLRDASGAIVGGFHHALDITSELRAQDELARVQDALRQSQKMEAVGQLTGGLAHDFNNLLTGMMGNLELLQMRVARGRIDDLDRFVLAAQGAGRRAASLTQRLLAFSRRQTLDPRPTDVNRLIAGMEEMLRRTVGPANTIEVVGAGGLWSANIDAGQLENALLNLCINARDAMPDGGRITIETANKWLDERAARERDLEPGQYLSVCVTDTGTGMPPEVVERVFEPFFTTKPLGEGTGLGLSMIYGFARQSGGQVRIYSEVDAGTTICIYLPRHAGGASSPEEARTGAAIALAGGETVLVVDDEATIRHLIDEVLDEAGYTVIGAADGAAGIKVLQSGARIELLITDVGLPGGMNGRQVADAARALRPGLKVLFITGYAENAAVGNGHLDPGMELLTKPFTMEALTAKVAAMMAMPGPGTGPGADRGRG